MTRETLWKDPGTGREIFRTDTASPAIVALLAGTIWGSRSLRYRILTLPEKLALLREPSYFVCTERGRVLGVILVDHCVKTLCGRDCGAYHFVMAATDPAHQSEGLASQILSHVRDYCIATVGAPGFGFAYVESTTHISLRLSDRIGHVHEADMPITLFTRFRPRDSEAVAPLDPRHAGAVRILLEELYADHELSDFGRSLAPDRYFTLTLGGEIVAGAQAEVLRWSVVDMPGLAGQFLLRGLPRLPLARSLLDLADLRIVRLGNLLLPEGRETEFQVLLEAILAREGAKIGMIMLDARSPVLERLRRHGRLGLLSNALKGSAKLRIDVVGMDPVMLDRLKTAPLLVSPADVF